MPGKPSLIAVPGMGQHTGDSFKKEIVDALSYALSLYPKWQGQTIDQLVDVVPCEYDSIFNEYRDAMADASKPLADRLATLQAAKLFPIVGEITKWDAELNKDNFFRTHWLDVLFYRYTMLAEPIRIKVARAVADEVKAKGAENVHVLGHSLGTAVVHDSLASLYVDGPVAEGGKNLSTRSSKLGSVHMVANVSRALESFAKVAESVVHPCGRGGCVFAYYQYRHIVDPFTIPSPFEPIANGIWKDPFSLPPTEYQRLRPRLVTELNTHSISSYLENPECHVPLLNSLGCGFSPAAGDVRKAFDAHGKKSLQGKAEMLQQKWDSMKLAGLGGAEAFIRAAQALRDLLARFGQSF
jgi:hypothetical protein